MTKRRSTTEVDRETDGTSLQVRFHRHRGYAFGKIFFVSGRRAITMQVGSARNGRGESNLFQPMYEQIRVGRSRGSRPTARCKPTRERNPSKEAQMVKAVWNDTVIAET